MVVPFPTVEDRAAVKTAVGVFLTSQSAATRVAMIKMARAILDRYRISKLNLDNCTVCRHKEPGWAYIQGRVEIKDRRCPGCGADIYKWPGPVKLISVIEGLKYDLATYGCSCGKIFMKKEAVM